jgi:hypothetical protein
MKNKIAITLFLGISLFSAAYGQQLKLAKDGMAILKGKRTFMLGLYETPKNDTILNQVVEAGFTIVAIPLKDSLTTNKALDKILAAGIGAWISGPFDLSRKDDKTKEALTKMVKNCGSHKALLAWEAPDEALWNVSTQSYNYRTMEELRLFGNLLKRVKDSAQRKAFGAKIQEIRNAYNDADMAKGQQAADALWVALGKKVPTEDFDLVGAPKRSLDIADGIKSGFEYVKSIDASHHPIFMNHAPRNQIAKLALYNRSADIVGCDIYPFPEFKTQHSDIIDHSLACVGGYTQRMRKSAPGKPIWMVLQGFSWGEYWALSPIRKREYPAPGIPQLRFMAFDAIVNGASGLNFWGTDIAKKDAKSWKDLLSVVHELKELQPLLSAPQALIKPEITLEDTFNSYDQSVVILPKQVGKEIWLIVVNENRNSNVVLYTINKLSRLNGMDYQEVLSGKKVTVKNGSLQLPIGGYGVQILKPVGR